jgi:small subunit ribosomal protein S20
MANHKSSQKRIRQSEIKRVANRYFAVTARNAIKKLRETKDKAEAQGLFPKLASMLINWQRKILYTRKKLQT